MLLRPEYFGNVLQHTYPEAIQLKLDYFENGNQGDFEKFKSFCNELMERQCKNRVEIFQYDTHHFSRTFGYETIKFYRDVSSV
jgi:hypothetical protein